ncbi:XdhC family protein [Dokdonella sp.]|uniref:XdhC family protein n=1 Tax=Dokdonella sp. TaxID=2291710 RepID=UPI00352879D2
MNADPTQTPDPARIVVERGSAGGIRAVVEAACTALGTPQSPTLAIVLETTGSTYVGSGAIALFAGASQTGWLSGGCLEPEIARRAAQAAKTASIEWMEVDTRDDEALFGGSAVGCRGRLRLALLPLRALRGWSALAAAWLARRGPMDISLSADGKLRCSVDQESANWQLPVGASAWASGPTPPVWQVRIEAPPSVLMFGAGPEAPVLLPLLRSMGWITGVAERRERWMAASGLADHYFRDAPAEVLLQEAATGLHAALVMHHNFELDLDALLALAENPPPFIGLLGPRRRRDDLFRLLPESARERLLPTLHSPVGLNLGGRGPEAIALSIAAQLQSKLHD